jgi:hypothetical protein
MIYQLFLNHIIMHPRGQAIYRIKNKDEDIFACAFVMLIWFYLLFEENHVIKIW